MVFSRPPVCISHGSIVGTKEAQGPLKQYFDILAPDDRLGQASWEKAECQLQQQAFAKALEKAKLQPGDLDMVFAGDLLNQCISSAFALRGVPVSYFGLYGACSTMAESLMLAAMAVDGGFAQKAAAMTSSHFASAERQYRFPLEYGGQRTPTAQWTVTGSGCAILSGEGDGPQITCATAGMVIDKGVKDANNMGCAMAPAAYATIRAHFDDLGLAPSDYDGIYTGDLGTVGKQVVLDFFQQDGVDLRGIYDDCGAMIFDVQRQDVHAGASGCGCAAVTLAYLLNRLLTGKDKRILLCATGALMSPVSTQQGESIPSICHAVCLERR